MANILREGCTVKEGDPALSRKINICIYDESHLPLY